MTTPSNSLAARVRYAFHNSLSAGAIALIGWLGLVSLAMIGAFALIVTLFGIAPEGSENLGFIEAFWVSLMRTLDSGTMGGDAGWSFRIAMLGVTLGGIFIVSTLIGILTSGIESQIDELRKGRSLVLEQDHTLILGWSSKVFTIISELAAANESRTRPRIVIVADRDKVEMEDEIRSKVGATGRTRVICRTGNPSDLGDLALGNPWLARAIIVPAPDQDDGDISAIKTVLALTNHPARPAGLKQSVVAELRDPRNLATAKLASQGIAQFVVASDFIARITVQTCRQSGLSVVLTELLDFGGDEIYFHKEASLAGRTFGDALLAYEKSAVIGISSRSGASRLNPPMDTVLAADDELIVIAEDDSKIVLGGSVPPADDGARTSVAAAAAVSERTLMLGWNERAPMIVREMDQYVAAGSVIEAVITQDEEEIRDQVGALKNSVLTLTHGDSTERRLLDRLMADPFDHVLVLCDPALGVDAADARTLVTLLHLRDIAGHLQKPFGLVTEMLDIRNIDLAQAARPDDFIVSDRLTSLMITQLSENPRLEAVLADIFDADGSEIYLKPATEYVAADREVTYSTIVAAARSRGEVAIGYRLAAHANDRDRAFGVTVNPSKAERLRFGADDRVIVLSES
jgi:voltage-gated potassium channel Kch